MLDASPDESDGHRLGLQAARQNRLDLITKCTARLMARMDAAADIANAKVLLHPTKAPSLVQSSNHVSGAIVEFQGRLGIEQNRDDLDPRRWTQAVTEVRDKALESGAEKVDAAKRLSTETFDRARSTTGKLSERIADRARRLRSNDDSQDESS
ncbi:hypothetical protein J2S40_001347 [Nocardioides luteus]|uniref:Uncharacterized protein n=1 Tax=Nocardioides luteus TaxID=1844 RepID=A0ABQ5T2I8_9ACTN|nr:hypothetical protein [Nocardioides luteus]MDR7310289.1 hypothetical protein [Nocardioides luteus]GGR53690.1 hypothetical protein GCM10010197_20160 [Nocardioides luteus]GLJ69932.1 hypothetical protein GCM10017579_39680 [Nocardioides luteus]